jgi:hypothetical protein
MKNGVFGGVLIFNLGLMALGAAAMADDTTAALPAQQSTTEIAPSTYDKIAEKVGLTYFGIYRGASVSTATSRLQPNIQGNPDPEEPISFENYVTAGYKPAKDWLIGAQAHFMLFPSGMNMNTGMDAQALDPSIVISKANLVDTHGLKLKLSLYTYIPMTSPDLLNKYKEATSIAPTFNLSYDVPKTALNLGLYGYVQGFVPTAATVDGARTWRIVAAPYGSYALTKSVQATLWFDFVSLKRYQGSAFFAGAKNDPMDIEPGINWDITPYISVNPILNIYPSNPTLAATSVQAVLVGKVF